MTPEELEVIPGIGPQVVEKILVAVNGYYAQFEPGQQEEMVAGPEPSEQLAAAGEEGGVGIRPAIRGI